MSRNSSKKIFTNNLDQNEKKLDYYFFGTKKLDYYWVWLIVYVYIYDGDSQQHHRFLKTVWGWYDSSPLQIPYTLQTSNARDSR